MGYETPSAPRFQLSEESEALTITLHPRRNWVAFIAVLGFLTFWWYTLLGFAGLPLDEPFSFFFYGISVVVTVFSVWAVLWSLFGEEKVMVNGFELRIRRSIFGTTYSDKSYEAAQVRRLRYTPPEQRGKSRIPSRIRFDYGARTKTFADGIDEAEARMIIEHIRSRAGGTNPELTAE